MALPGGQRGFTLVELLLALSLGGLLAGVILQGLLGEAQLSQRLGRQWRERAQQRRTLELIRGELRQANAVATGLPAGGAAACGLGGRTVVLHLAMGPGLSPITYTVGAAPSAIWRGAVLMRCGPAYGLQGALGDGTPQNRVLLDGLAASGGFVAEAAGPGVLRLRLRQTFVPATGSPHTIVSEAMGAG